MPRAGEDRALEAEKSGMATRSGHPVNLSAHWRARSKGKRKPLCVSAAGCGLQDAADRVLRMRGPHRIPALVRRADQLFPLRLLIASTAPAQFTVTVAEPLGPLWPLLAVTVTGAPVLIARNEAGLDDHLFGAGLPTYLTGDVECGSSEKVPVAVSRIVPV